MSRIVTAVNIIISQTIKYGVTTIDNLCSDLLNWSTLYLAGRMHKPLRIIKDDARVRLTQQVNLTSAARAALLTMATAAAVTREQQHGRWRRWQQQGAVQGQQLR
jgi:hypothetical protein